jgi:hypothetical protein
MSLQPVRGICAPQAAWLCGAGACETCVGQPDLCLFQFDDEISDALTKSPR